MEPVKVVTMAALVRKQRKMCSSEMLFWIFAVTFCAWRCAAASRLTGKSDQCSSVNDQLAARFLLLLPYN